MEKKSKSCQKGWLTAFIISAVLIATSLGYCGYQLKKSTKDQKIPNLEDQISAGIDKYFVQKEIDAQKQQKEKQKQAEAKTVSVDKVDQAKDHIYGNPDTPITLIEFSDLDCPYCARFHKTAKLLVDKNHDKVNWVSRHFPLQRHGQSAINKAVASECVNELGGNDNFWKYLDYLYTELPPAETDILAKAAVDLGINKSKFTDCLKSGKYEELIRNELKNGIKSGITGTPGNILIHNASHVTKLVAGNLPYANLVKKLKELEESIAHEDN